MNERNLTIEKGYLLQSLLNVLSLAIDGEQIAGRSFD